MPNMKLIVSIIGFLKKESDRLTSLDTKESLEVAVQCLQTAYDVDYDSPKTAQYILPNSLEEIFDGALLPTRNEDELDDKAVNKEPLNKAETMKNLGNNLMKNNQFSEAVRYYTAAIEIDGSNAVYYCNRAAAYSKLNDFHNAIKDCQKAVEIEPKYAKAYGRMGLAYTSLEQNDLAIKAFKQALEIEPNNESYQSNLKIAIEKKERPNNPAANFATLGTVDWHTLFSNPAFRNMATSIMQDPNILSALSAGLGGSLSQVAAAVNASVPEPPTPPPSSIPGGNRSLDMLLEAGQYLATQMQAANPDLIDQLRQNPYRNPSNPENKDSAK
ncbi:small glutamine-rich tetratricopeptide repeat-containing protein beta-like isoform X2 [Argiope bruennichi]|uniref:Small glutamine-rich tetratricopeptide like protein n=2 Tax=Argiope bruennichi TaxID=94029 RepID=A0A8T0FGS2_ARGBR|nr:small glutamine-rich tetratricopeptide repeat-containing protein beta-like isoform X2 [Argiope bruennichi]KAF8790474.1 Small glutamine-rich tetratricopeptide like protein [Argiope bruennichi]